MRKRRCPELGSARRAVRENAIELGGIAAELVEPRPRIGAIEAISASASAGLNAPKPWPAKRAEHLLDAFAGDRAIDADEISALRAARRAPAGSSGSGSGSVFALRIFCAISSSLSVRLIRLMSDGSDLDIFAWPSRRLITRAPVPPPMIRLGQDEQVDVVIGVELDRDVAGQLDMLLLVLADRHVGRLVEQDVGGLEHGISEEPDRWRLRGSCPLCP